MPENPLFTRLAENSGLQPHLASSQAKAYRYAVLRATQETPLEETAFPANCPFTVEQTLDESYWPD